MKLRRLNHIVVHYETEVQGDYNKLVKVNGSALKCRYKIGNRTYRDSKGEDIEYHAGLHCNYSPQIKKGHCIKIKNKDYKVLSAFHTPDLQGNLFKTYVLLKEFYYG